MTAFQPGSPAYEALIAEIEGLRVEVAILRTTEAAEIERLRNNYFILKQDYDALRAENARLRAALEPFARNVEAVSLSATLGHITREHLWEARRALEPKT